MYVIVVEQYRFRKAFSKSDHVSNNVSLLSNQRPADLTNLPRTISRISELYDVLLGFVRFLILFRKRSTSSDGCPEKFGRSSNRAFLAFANRVGSVICCVFVSLVVLLSSFSGMLLLFDFFLIEWDTLGGACVMTVYEMRS